jgi:hypothetical protein
VTVRGRGRPKGSTSWHQNPAAVAGHHLNGLIEMWLAGVPIGIGDGRWLVGPSGRKRTVPPKIKRMLVEFAVRHAEQLTGVRPDVAAVLAWSRRRAPPLSLRLQR